MNINYKIDLHTHSIISQDGGISALEYEKLLTTGVLDCIAITDHNETSFARIMQQKLGPRIIIGEEIMSAQGEIIGLYLKETIAPGQSAAQTVKQIHQQDGLVYVPHPFETFRKGVQKEVLEEIHNEIDIMEVFNGRGKFRGKHDDAREFAMLYQLAGAASSDAHCRLGIKTYSSVSEIPTRKSLPRLLSQAILYKKYAPFYTIFCPAINKFKNRVALTNV